MQFYPIYLVCSTALSIYSIMSNKLYDTNVHI